MIVADPTAVRGAVLAYRAADADVRRDINTATRRTLTPLWSRVVQSRTVTAQDRAVLAPASVRGGNPGRLVAASARGRLSGGLDPGSEWAFVEFGSRGAHASRGQLPRWRRPGRVVFPAVKSWAPTATRVWLGVILDAYRRRGAAVDGG